MLKELPEKNEALTRVKHGAEWKKPTQKATRCRIPFIWNEQNRQAHGGRTQVGGGQEEGSREWPLTGTGSDGVMATFWG